MPAPKLTREIQDRIVESLREGAFRITAAHLVGIHRATLQEWVDRGERVKDSDEVPESEVVYRDFAVAVQMAEAEAELVAVKQLRSATSKGDAKGVAIWLERRHRDRWGSHRTVELTGAGGGPVQHGVVVLPAQIPNGSTMTACLVVEGREVPQLPEGESNRNTDDGEDLGEP